MDDAKPKKSRPGYLTKYARHANLSLSSASEQLKRVGIDYTHEFDFADADRRREAARHADRMPFTKPIHDPALPDYSMDDGNDEERFVFAEHQAKREKYKAELIRLEFEERIRKLIEVEKVDQEWFRLGRIVRDAMLNIPARVAGLLAAENNERKVYDVLETEIHQALESLTNGIKTDATDCSI